MDRSRLGIVIPALNESATIVGVVEAAERYGVPIVVDDGSTDDTAKLAQQAGASVVLHGQNLGYDAALNSGFNKAMELGCAMVITIDADGQHDPYLIQSLSIESMPVPISRLVFAAIDSDWQSIYFLLFSLSALGFQDPLCGMKAYRRDSL